jgi:hypothetical protein
MLMDEAGYIKHWGEAHLTRWPLDVLRDVRIPEGSKAFLANVGMPSPGRKIGPYELSWELSLPDVGEDKREFARNYSAPYLLDEGNGGCVLAASNPALPGSRRAMNPERWLNSSVEQFAAFITEQDKLHSRAAPYDIKDADNVALLERRWKEIDPAALADPNGFWGLGIYDLRMP